MGVLSNLRVVEIGSSAATSYCARLFADFGADVQKVEPPAGDPLRRSAPLTSKGQSAWFAFLNFNKSSMIIDHPTDPDAIAQLTGLVERCDILVDGRGVDATDCPPIDIVAIRQRRPGLIYLEASWFGNEGPYAGFAATDSTVRALAGLIKLVGPVEGPPLHAPDFQTGILAGLWGFIAVASSAVARMQSEKGRSWSLSILESSLTLSEYLMFQAFACGDVMRRVGTNRFWPTFPAGIYETKKGWLGVTTGTPAQWREFCDMLVLSELRDDPNLAMGVDRLQHVDKIEREFMPKLKTRTAQEWFSEGLKRKVPIVPVPEISALLQDAEKKERGAIVPILVGEEECLTVGSMQRLTLTPPRRGGKVPAPAEQQAIVNTGRPLIGGAARSYGCIDAGGPPLQGIRVIDFSMGWAGPLCTRTLADLGADVIKIEAIQYPDWWRGVDRRPAYVGSRMYEMKPEFCIMNRNKRGITLDLKRPQGVALAKRLSVGADIVVDNYSVDVLPKLGLGYDVLRTLNPRVVMISMSAFGTTTVGRNCRAYGSTFEQASGLPCVVGTPSASPVMSHVAFGDAVGGLNGCAAVLVALVHARNTGQGQFIDLAQVECMMPFAAPWITIQSIDGTLPKRYGNRHPQFVPHGCFRCAGEDNWIVVAVTDEQMWRRLAILIGRPDWARDVSLQSADARRNIEELIETVIEDWSVDRLADQAMAELQSAKVAAGVARLPSDLLKDQHLKSRDFLQEVERAFVGLHPQPSMPIREGAGPYPIRSGAPTLGQHNGDILSNLLGLSVAEIERLASEGIIGTKMLSEGELAKARTASR